MGLRPLIHIAFENIRPYISNVDAMKSLIEELEPKATSIQNLIRVLYSKMSSAEVTLRTDIRILVNEIEKLARKEPHG